MSEYSINASGINISFDGVQILNDVDFKVKTGEVHALVGTNGAGKSTLVKIINGVYKKDSGRISLFDKSSDYDTPEGALQAGIAMVFQDLSLIPSLTVAQNIFLQTHPYRKGLLIDDKKGNEKAIELLALIGVDTEISPSDRVEDLSVGKQQIIEIAKALSHNPKVLILDEPTASLSSVEIECLFDVIMTLKRKGISIIYITHYLQDIFKICDSLTLLRDGEVVFREETTEIDLKFLVDAMAGGESETISWNRNKAKRKGTPILEIKNLTTNKINNIDLKIYPGEIVGIAGLLGSGRSELLQALFGIDKLKNGEILVEGKSVIVSSSSKAIDEGITLVPGNRREQGLVLDFAVQDNIVLSIINRLKKFVIVDKVKIRNIVNHYIKSLNVKTQGPDQKVRFLSGGNQQKIVVAKCLASDSKILLLDDPTFGVDIHAKHEIMKIIIDYASKGNGVLFVSSEFNEIAGFCDSIYIMKKGSITEFLSDSVSEDELLYKVQ